jgi:hypothetical protein
MSLDLDAISRQITAMAADLAALAQRMRLVSVFAAGVLREWHARQEEAQMYLEGIGSGGVWPFAIPLEPLLTSGSLPPEPHQYTALAVDGSQIDADGHALVRCMLINIGWAVLRYGDQPAAWLESAAHVLHQDADVYAAADDGQYRAVEEHVLSMERTVAELERLADLAAQHRDSPNPVAIADGSLVRWEFGGRRPTVGRAVLLQRYTAALARFRALRVPVCSFISRPNAREVANALSLLQVQRCSGDRAACSTCRARSEPLCSSLRQLADRDLLTHLPVGRRSALFRVQSPVLDHYAPEDRVQVFYLQLAQEMARVELPVWCCAPAALERIHAVLYSQCLHGRGYPVALMEAHEQAVIHSGAREAFRILLLQALNWHDLEASVSAKRLSKDQRAV